MDSIEILVGLIMTIAVGAIFFFVIRRELNKEKQKRHQKKEVTPMLCPMFCPKCGKEMEKMWRHHNDYFCPDCETSRNNGENRRSR